MDTKNQLPPVRCTCCNRLLLKGDLKGNQVEIKCPGCGTMNTFNIHTDARNFQDRIYINRKYNQTEK